MNIAIIGIGAMGTLFAAQLSRVTKVTIIGSWEEQLTALRSSGLRFIDIEGNMSRVSLSVQEYDSARGVFPFVFVLVKGWQTKQATRAARQLLAADGLAITLQNGLGNLDIVASAVGHARSAMGVTSEGAMIEEPGTTRHTGLGATHLGMTAITEARVDEAAELLKSAGFETHVTGNLDSLVWGKLAINCGINALSALLQVRNGYLVEEPTARGIMRQAAREAEMVAKKQGIQLPYESAEVMAVQVAKATASNRSSMAQDIARGAPTEIESINGMVLKIAQHLDLDVPVNKALVELIRQQIQDGDWREAVDKLPLELRPVFLELSQQREQP